jgi:hypothetical protein
LPISGSTVSNLLNGRVFGYFAGTTAVPVMKSGLTYGNGAPPTASLPISTA